MNTLDNSTRQANLQKYLTNGRYDCRKSAKIAEQNKNKRNQVVETIHSFKASIEMLCLNGITGILLSKS